MQSILPLKPKITALLKKHSLEKKFAKQILLLTENPAHPSLIVEPYFSSARTNPDLKF